LSYNKIFIYGMTLLPSFSHFLETSHIMLV